MKGEDEREDSGKEMKITSSGKTKTGSGMDGSKKRKKQSEKEESGKERRGQTGEKEKKASKKRVKEKDVDVGDGEVVVTKKAKPEKEKEENYREISKEKDQIVEKSVDQRKRVDKALHSTARKSDMLEAMLDSSISSLTGKAVLTEVELLQTSVDQKACREEQERERDDTIDWSPVEMEEEESMKEMQNRSICNKEEREKEVDSDLDDHVVWVQCSRADCNKWRKLSEDVDPSFLPDDWTCENNSDPAFSSCSFPEEQCSTHVEEIFFSSFVHGSLVWAQQTGHPCWPAMIERDPDTDDYVEFNKKTDTTPEKFHVTYFGDPVYIGWVPCSNVKNYTDLSEEDVFNMLEQKKLGQKLKDAISMSKQALDLPLQMRLMKFGFWSRYESDREDSEEDSDFTEFFERFSGKSGKYSDDEDGWPPTQKLKEGEEKQQRGVKKGHKKKAKETSAEKLKKKSEHENKQSVKKKVVERNKMGDIATKSVEAGLKVTKQKDLEEKKSFNPLFSPKKNKPSQNIDAGKQKIQDQEVPQSAVKKTSRCFKGDVKVRERKGDECRREEKQNMQKLKRWMEDFSEVDFPEDEEEGNDEGFLDTDTEILGCRKMSCKDDEHEEKEDKEEEEENDFSLMLLEEEE